MKVDFYHLAASPVAAVLPRIAARLVAAGERLLVVSEDAAARAALDAALWSWHPESFLPHGEAGSGDDAVQPVLIAAAPIAANGARNIALVDGVWRDAALGFARTFHFFDDRTIEAARAAWRMLAGHGEVERRFWKQDGQGRWEQTG